MVVVLIIVVVMHQLPVFGEGSLQTEAVIAFVVGLFPLVGLQALNSFVARFLRSSVPSLQSAYPLSDLEGLNVWYEARLMEEGIEDMQNLVSANIVDVLLHTRVPVGRLIDWCDQAQLFVHLSPLPGWRRRASGSRRAALGSFGVRSATTFLKAFADGVVDAEGEPRRSARPPSARAPGAAGPRAVAAGALMIARVLAGSPALRPIQSWKALEGAASEAVPASSAATVRLVPDPMPEGAAGDAA